MKRGPTCKCLLCHLGQFRDLRTLIKRACGTTLNVIDNVNTTTSVPLLMARAAHEREPLEWLKKSYIYLLDILYDPWNLSLAVSLIYDGRFYRDQVTFHHAIFHRSRAYAELLVNSGCPVMVYKKKECLCGECHVSLEMALALWGEATPFYGFVHNQCTENHMFRNSVLGSLSVEHLSTIDGIEFVSWRTAEQQPEDMEVIYKAERDWQVKQANARQEALRSYVGGLYSAYVSRDSYALPAVYRGESLFIDQMILMHEAPVRETPNIVPSVGNAPKTAKNWVKQEKKARKREKQKTLRHLRAENRFRKNK